MSGVVGVPQWTDPVWRGQAHRWIEEQLTQLDLRAAGPIEQPHVYPWSTVLRVPTASGDVYFKPNTPALRHEAAVVALLAEQRPDCIPRLLAVERELGWMLMADAGTRLRELIERERDLGRWLDVLPLYAGVQIELVDRADELVALGVPDLRLDTLPTRYEELLARLDCLPSDERRRLEGQVPEVAEMCRKLAGYGLPETIQHDDLPNGQVCVDDGRYLLLDWGDVRVSNPFFTLAVTLEGVIAWGIDTSRGRSTPDPSAPPTSGPSHTWRVTPIWTRPARSRSGSAGSGAPSTGTSPASSTRRVAACGCSSAAVPRPPTPRSSRQARRARRRPRWRQPAPRR